MVRAGLGLIPVAGSAAAELFKAVMTPPLDKRRNEWMDDVGQRLQRLEKERDISLEDLKNNDEFIDAVMSASQAVLRTSQAEKKEALRNAVINTAIGQAPEESIQQMFINFISEFTPWHLKLLELFQDPQVWAEKNNHQFPNYSGAGLSSIIENAFPQLDGQRSFYDQVAKDLHIRGLIVPDNLHITITGRGLMERKTTAAGNQFLKYIKDPLENE